METQLVLTVLGIYMAVAGLAMLFRRERFLAVAEDLFAHPALMWVAGLVVIYLGGVLAFADAAAWWVTVLGWMMIAKGASYIIFPDLFRRLFPAPTARAAIVSGVLTLIAAAILLYATLM